MVYALTKLIIWPILSLFIKKIKGLENLPKKPYILAMNHSSYVDGLLIIMLLAWHKNEKIYTFATNEKFTGPIWDILIHHYGGIRINGSLEAGMKKLKQGKIMAIFPEGGRTPNGKIQETKHTGLGVLALQTKAPIVPIHLNTYKWWNRNQLFPNFKKNIQIKIGRPIKFNLKPNQKNYLKLVQKTMNEVKKLVNN